MPVFSRSTHKFKNTAEFWIILILLWMISLITQHDLSFNLNRINIGSEQLAERVEEGSLTRRISLPIMGVLGLICLARYSRKRLHLNGFIGMAMVALLLWMYASILWSVESALTLRRLIAFSLSLISAFGTAALAFRKLPLVIFIFCGLNLLVGVTYEFISGSFNPFTDEYRFGGTLHPNLQGVNISLLLISCMWLIIERGRKNIAFITGIMISATILLVLTQSRTSMGAFLIASGFTFALYVARRHGKQSLLALLSAGFLILCPIIIFFLINSNNFIDDMALEIITRERDKGNPLALTGRVELWKLLYSEYITSKPIIGYGHDAFWSSERILEVSNLRNWPINQAHNSYFEIILNLGIIGAILYILVHVLGILIGVKYYLEGESIYGYTTIILLFIMMHNFLESINMLPLFSGFISYLILFKISFIKD